MKVIAKKSFPLIERWSIYLATLLIFSASTLIFNVLASNSTPTATDVTITGTPAVGEILTGNYTYSFTPSWRDVGTPRFSVGEASYTSIVFDSTDTPYVSYADSGLSLSAVVKKFDGNDWVTVGVEGFSAGASNYNSIAIDPVSDLPYVAYRDPANGSKATVMKFDGADWVLVGTAGFTSDVASTTTITVDSSGTPYVAFVDGSTGSKASVMKFDGADWVLVGIAGFSSGTTNFMDSAIDSTGTPYVAYRDNGNGGKATVMKFDGVDWVVVGTEGFSDNAVTSTFYPISIAIDSGGTPYVAYREGAGSPQVVIVRKFNGSDWVDVGTNGLSADSIANTALSIAIDSDDKPYVAYEDYGTVVPAATGKATVMKFDGADWVTVGTAGFSASQSWHIDIAVNSLLEPFVVYKDLSASPWKATAMMFPTNDDGAEGTSTFKWYRDDVEIVGETASTYTITTDDLGTTIKFEVTPISASLISGTPVQSDGFDIPELFFGLSATSGEDSQSTLSWSAPILSGITDYNIEYKLTSEPTTWTTFIDGVSISLSAVVTGLINRSSYDFRVTAEYSGGTSDPSNEDSATPYGISADVIPISNANDLDTDGGSCCASVSADGRYVAYQSDATNIVAGDTNGVTDVFVYDKNTDTTERISVNSVGAEGDGASFDPSITPDGRYVAFDSDATNLVSGDTNGLHDIFVYDRTLNTVERVSISSTGEESDASSEYIWGKGISSDGRYVTFYSNATNLVPNDTNGTDDVFVYDRTLNTIERVSVASNGDEGDTNSDDPSISPDGRYVAFYSCSTNLVPNDTNGLCDAFVYDRTLDTIERVSIADDGTEGDTNSYADPVLSSDGRYVAFQSDSTNLVAGDTNAVTDIFVYDRTLNTIERVSVDDNGVEGNGNSNSPSISWNGRYVTFFSNATNLVSDDTNGFLDIFVYDRDNNTVEKVPVTTSDFEVNSNSSYAYYGAISFNGNWVTFESDASNLIQNDPNNSLRDIFLVDLGHPADPDCDDGLDNDGDGYTDYPNDPGCESATDDTETSKSTPQACEDGLDNDGDGKVDFPQDPGCQNDNDNDETNSPAVCSDGIDNDSDGKTDYPSDPGCFDADDVDETDQATYQCSDGIDNDGDSKIDLIDPGCSNLTDNDETDLAICINPQAINTGDPLPCRFDQTTTCQNPNANNIGAPLPCTFNQTVCQNPSANNYGQVGACTFDQVLTCQNPNANNIGSPLPCTFDQAICQNPSANNYGQVGACTFDQTEPFCVTNPTHPSCVNPPPPDDGGTGFKDTYLKAGKVPNILSSIGVLVGALSTLLAVMFLNPLSAAEIVVLPLRLWSLLLSALGIKKRTKAWGVAFDARTKQPLDPVHITLRDLEGKEVATAITDIDGRYGFLVPKGIYKMEPSKPHYLFASKILSGKTRDELYGNLYFGDYFEIKEDGQVITFNIPMDPLNFDWNEFIKRDQKLMRFYSKRDFVLARISTILFTLGAIMTVVSVIVNPTIFNKIVLALYVVMYALRVFGLSPQKLGSVSDKETHTPLSFAVIHLINKTTGFEISRKVANANGRFYCLAQNGTYTLKVDRKNIDESYSFAGEQEVTVKNGILKGRVKV